MSFRQPAQPKRDSALKQKARIVSSREIWGSSQNRFFTYNQKKPSRAQKDIFGTYSTSFWKVSILLRKPIFLKVLDITRHLKRRMERAKVPNVAFEVWRSRNVTLHLNKKHVLFQVKRSEENVKTGFLITTEATSPPELKKTFLERTQPRFGKFLFCSGNQFFFKGIRYHKTSQTQDGTSQSTNRSLRKLAQAKPNTSVERN